MTRDSHTLLSKQPLEMLLFEAISIFVTTEGVGLYFSNQEVSVFGCNWKVLTF